MTAPASTVGLQIHALSVRYPTRREPSLRDVSVVVDGGQVLGVAGRTGAGKSTLALASAGFIPRVVRAALDGTVHVAGVSTSAASAGELAERVGIVFSTPANQLSASKLTVREELAFGLENLGVPRVEMDGRIDEVLDHLGIAHLADREPFALSGGEQQRVAIASIIAMGTRVIALDEPTAQLDPAGTSMVSALLRSLAADGRAVLVAEHDPAVLGPADRCLVLDLGRVVALDRPGAALGPDVLTPIGLQAPTIVRIAHAAGVDPARAFEEDVVVDALRTGRLGDGAGEWPAAASATHAPGTGLGHLASIRGEPAVDVEMDGIVHRYPGGVEAVRGVDLAIPAGSSVAIVGQNGSGKTTLVKHLNGLLRPDAGVVRIGQRDIRSEAVNAVARRVGFVFQNPDEQLFNRSVEREVGFGPRNLGLDATTVHALVERALGLTGLAASRSVNPYDLDFSLRKLVALASVVAMEPGVLVLDEPTTGQDGPGRDRVGAIVDAFVAAGRTVVAITHDMEFAAAHFERIVVMREGRIVADGRPQDVFAREGWDTLASTGLIPPVSSRIGDALGLGSTPTERVLVEAIAGLHS